MLLGDIISKYNNIKKQIEATQNGILMWSEQGLFNEVQKEAQKLKVLSNTLKQLEAIKIEIIEDKKEILK